MGFGLQPDVVEVFLAAGEAALATKSATGEELESDRLKAKLGADRARSAAREDRRSGGEPPFVATDVQAMRKMASPVTGKPYGLAAVCRAWRIARSGIYRHRTPPSRHRDGVDRWARCRMRR
jgi:hypothetical protein